MLFQPQRMSEQELSAQIEALLFALGRPISRDELLQKLSCSAEELERGILKLRSTREESGVSLMDDGRMLELRASAGASSLIEQVRKDEYARDIGRAGLEALSAILYRGPLTRSEIDFIRGVNSTQTLRTLTMRGLIRKLPNPKDERSFLYEPTTELLSWLGISRRQELPDFNQICAKLADLEAAYRQAETPREH